MKRPPEPALRSYFFGPGYRQLAGTVHDAWVNNKNSALKIGDICKKWTSRTATWFWLFKTLAVVFIFLFRVISYVVLYGFGSLFTAIFSLLHGCLTFAVMCVIYVLFAIAWLVDRLFLLLKQITSQCPICKHRMLIPTYICPVCKAEHARLYPGVYGVLYHRCRCGKKLPCTFLNGRNKLNAICPNCKHEIKHAETRIVNLLLIGGSSAGKTAYLSALMEVLQSCFSGVNGIRVECDPEDGKNSFKQLHEYYEGAPLDATRREDYGAIMYSMVVTSPEMIPSRHLAIFDISGEFFERQRNEIAQQQIEYCDGIVFLIDVLTLFDPPVEVRKKISTVDTGSESKEPPVDVLNQYINYYRDLHPGANKILMPISVVIAKSDVYMGEYLYPDCINEYYLENPVYHEKESGRSDARDAYLRNLILNKACDGSNLINLLDNSFHEVHYFAVSASGATPKIGQRMMPWAGLAAPVLYVIAREDQKLSAYFQQYGGEFR